MSIVSNHIKHLFVTDWKYLDFNFFLVKSRKLSIDITKQLCYEFCFRGLSIDNNICNQFVIPFFYKENKQDKIGSKANPDEFYERLRKSGIEVFKANFYTMQDIYLNYD
jgi:hypothetical protein